MNISVHAHLSELGVMVESLLNWSVSVDGTVWRGKQREREMSELPYCDHNRVNLSHCDVEQQTYFMARCIKTC